MNVAELIAELQKLNPEMTVVAGSSCGYDWAECPVQEVKVEKRQRTEHKGRVFYEGIGGVVETVVILEAR